MIDDYQTMRRCIDRAVTLEQHKGLFRRALRHSLDQLHPSIQLPARDAPLHLTCFTIRYVQAAPVWLERMEALCNAAGLELTPVRELLGRCFAEPPERHPDHVGLAAILDEAYLVHRVLEEINEQLQPLCGTPLLPMNPMVANLVVGELLGEGYAGELDRISAALARRFEGLSLSPQSLVALVLHKQRYDDPPGQWPDFAETLDIVLRPLVPEREADTIH